LKVKVEVGLKFSNCVFIPTFGLVQNWVEISQHCLDYILYLQFKSLGGSVRWKKKSFYSARMH